jgi:FkbM family methyltransferase
MNKMIGLGRMLSRLVKICNPIDIMFYILDFLNFPLPSLHKYSLRNGIIVYARSRCSDRSEMVNILSGHEYGDLYGFLISHDLKVRTVIDAGANIGLFTLYIARILNVNAQFLLIEPDSDNLIFLKNNLAANQLVNYKIYDKALYKENKVIKFNNSLDYDSRRIDIKNGNKLIHTTTLKELFAENKISSLDLLKIDIEGSEWELFTKENLKYFDRVEAIILEYHLDRYHSDIQPIRDYFANFQFHFSSSNERSGVIFLNKKQHA